MKPRNKVYCYTKEEKEEKQVILCLKSLLGNVWSFCKQPALSKKSSASYIILIIAALYQVRSVKVKSLYLTSVVPSVTRLILMEADGAPFTPLPLSVLRFTGIQSYGYTDQRKVETDVEVTEDRTGDLSLGKPGMSQLSHDC